MAVEDDIVERGTIERPGEVNQAFQHLAVSMCPNMEVEVGVRRRTQSQHGC